MLRFNGLYVVQEPENLNYKKLEVIMPVTSMPQLTFIKGKRTSTEGSFTLCYTFFRK